MFRPPTSVSGLGKYPRLDSFRALDFPGTWSPQGSERLTLPGPFSSIPSTLSCHHQPLCSGLGRWRMSEEAPSSGELLAGAVPDKGLLLCWRRNLIITVGAEKPSHREMSCLLGSSSETLEKSLWVRARDCNLSFL